MGKEREERKRHQWRMLRKKKIKVDGWVSRKKKNRRVDDWMSRKNKGWGEGGRIGGKIMIPFIFSASSSPVSKPNCS